MSLKDFEKIDKKLDRSIDSTNSRIKKSYEGAIKELRSYFFELYDKYGDNGVLPYYELSKYSRLYNTKKEVEGVASSLYSSIIDDLYQDLESVYAVTYDSTIGVLTKEAGRAIRGSVKVDAIEKAIKAPIAGLTIDLRMEQYEQDLANKILQQIIRGSAEGWSASQLSKSMSEVFTSNNYYIRRIVETESHRIAEQSKLDTMERAEAQGNDVYKQWVSAKDSRVRTSHRQLNGKTIKKGEMFVSPSGGKGLAPGNMGTASDDINCRCYLRILIKK